MPDFDFGNAVNVGLLVTLIAVFVAGLAAVLGIWMERDHSKPPRYAWALSALIILATFVSLMQSYLDTKEQDALKEDMARLLATMDKLAHESDDPALKELVKSELTAQSRSNPEVIDKVAQRVSDEGRDPGEVLGRNLDAAEAEKVARKSSVKPKTTEKTDAPKVEEKQGAAAPVEPRHAPPASMPGAARAGAIDPGMAARMGAAAPGAAPGAPPTDPAATQAAPAPTPTPVPIAAPPGSPEAKAAAAAARRGPAPAPTKDAPAKPAPKGRKPTPRGR